LAASKVVRARRPSYGEVLTIGEVLTMRERRVLLALDEAPSLARETRVFALADEVEGDAEWRRTGNLSKRMLACGAWWSRPGTLSTYPSPPPGFACFSAALAR
jgi:hypothetical protein